MYATPSVAAGAYRQELTERLAAFLLEKGYALCDNVGRAVRPSQRHTNMVGVLLPDVTLPQGWFARVFRRRPRRVRLCTIWTNNATFGATPDYWNLKGDSRDYAEMTQQLAKELRKEFGVGIDIRIGENDLAGEVFAEDLG